jgi:hypothetical protein
MITKEAPTYWINIYLSGSIERVKDVCRQFVERGLCVTVTPTTYIYKYGLEEGVIVGLLNYPRFPKEPKELDEHARSLGWLLMLSCNQGSVLMEYPDRTVWLTRREDYIEEEERLEKRQALVDERWGKGGSQIPLFTL